MHNTGAYVEVSRRYPCKYCWIVNLNYITIGVTSNQPVLPGANYICFHEASAEQLKICDFHVSLYVTSEQSKQEQEWLADRSDHSFRSDRFKSGFYITHHFGAPAFLVSSGRNYYVVGSTLDTLLWSYFTKLLLTIEAERRGDLHLKAACVELEGRGILLTGRGSGGKTVMLFEACRNGGVFVANTHCIVNERQIVGVHSPMRVRSDAIFASTISALGATKHVEPGEYALLPQALFPAIRADTAAGAICIVDFRPSQPARVECLTADNAIAFLELFAFPAITYAMKDDMLTSVKGDHFLFCEMMRNMKQKLGLLLDRLPAFYVSIDATQPDQWRYFREAIFEQAKLAPVSNVHRRDLLP